MLEEKNFKPTPNEVNRVFDDKITSRPLKRKDNPFSRHLEPDRVRKFNIPISKAVKNFEDKQKSSKNKVKIDNIRGQLVILQQKLDKLGNLDIPTDLSDQYSKIAGKITKTLEIGDKNDETLANLSEETINDIKSMIQQAQNFINKIHHINQKDKQAEIAKPIRKDLERLATTLQEIEHQLILLKITPEQKNAISSVIAEAKGVLSFKNRGDALLTENFGKKVDIIVEKANVVLEEIKQEKRIFQDKEREKKRIDFIRENFQTLETILNKPEFKSNPPAGISQNLLKEKSRVLDTALKAIANRTKPDRQLSSFCW